MFNKELLMVNNGGSGGSDWYKGLPYIQIEAYPNSHSLSGLDQDGANVFTLEIDTGAEYVYIDIDAYSPQVDYIDRNAPQLYYDLFGGDYSLMTLPLLCLFPNDIIFKAFVLEYPTLMSSFLDGLVDAFRYSLEQNPRMGIIYFLSLFEGIGFTTVLDMIQQLILLYPEHGGEYLIEDDYVYIEVTPCDIGSLIIEMGVGG